MNSNHKAFVTGIDQIWLINLARRSDRLERFLQAQPEMTGRLNILPAYDGTTLELTPALARLFAPNNFEWHKPTMGCALSHLALWQRLAVEPNPSASYLILEDDARLEPAWVRRVEEAFLSGSVPADYEVLYLGGILPQYRESFEANVQRVNPLVGRVNPDCVFGKNPRGYFHFCAYAYVLSQRGARRLLDLIHTWNGYWLQADFVAAYHTPDLAPPRKIYFLHPLIAESFQDTAQGLTRPYDENQGQETKVDSDIWKNNARFTSEEVTALNSAGQPLDIPAALGWAPDAPLSKAAMALRVGTESAVPISAIPSSTKNTPSAIDKIWVINLERRPDRLKKFQESHPDIANHMHVLKAYDGRSLRLTPKIARLFAPNEFQWNKATMGCSLSHLELWYQLAQEPDENARYLILEDDTRLSPGWQEVVENAFADGDVPKDWDVLYLGGVLPKNEETFAKCKEKVAGSVFQVIPNGWFGQKPPNRYFHFGANAYILSKKGAANLLEFIKIKNGIWPQADFLLGYVFPETHPIRLTHYFFDPLLAMCYQDLETGFQKSYSEARGEGKIDSDIWMEANFFEEKIAKSLFSSSEPYDISGALAEARSQTRSRSHAENAKISLLHATRGRPYEAVKARELWFGTARHPQRIEHFLP